MNNIFTLLEQKFTSGNDVEVSSIRITRTEWEEAKEQSAKDQNLRDCLLSLKFNASGIETMYQELQEAIDDLEYVHSYIEECSHWDNREPLLKDIEGFISKHNSMEN